jgi:hypothetical protein
MRLEILHVAIFIVARCFALGIPASGTRQMLERISLHQWYETLETTKVKCPVCHGRKYVSHQDKRPRYRWTSHEAPPELDHYEYREWTSDCSYCGKSGEVKLRKIFDERLSHVQPCRTTLRKRLMRRIRGMQECPACKGHGTDMFGKSILSLFSHCKVCGGTGDIEK